VRPDEVQARGFVAHLKKPVRLELLFAAVEKCIREHKANT
jgi:alpha-D-ribose 1-methylphosphonate 5-triphosphate synthase subunit PhnI